MRTTSAEGRKTVDFKTVQQLKAEVTDLMATMPVSFRAVARHFATAIVEAVESGASKRQVAISLCKRLHERTGVSASPDTMRRYVADVLKENKAKQGTTVSAGSEAEHPDEKHPNAAPQVENGGAVGGTARAPKISPPTPNSSAKTIVLAGVDSFVKAETRS